MADLFRLIFTEKPSVARDIASVLGVTRKREGFLEGNGYIVTWGIGHLVTLAEPEEQDPSWKKWDLEHLPMLPQHWKLSILPNAKAQFEIVKELMSRPDVAEIINAADAGREGELIFRLVYRHTGCTKPVKRLWISSMTDEAIREGFASLRPSSEFDALARAAECRQRADWLVGLNLTRAYTKKYGDILTIGRVQTPTLAMVVKRHHEIATFKPRDYWEIRVSFGDFSAIWFDPNEKEYPTRLWEKEAATFLAQKLEKADAEVQKITSTRKKQPPPLLYDLTSLQRDANSKYGYTAAQTLAAAQALYERHKVITYPRTDSRHLSEDLYSTMARRLAALPSDYSEFTNQLKSTRLPKSKRVFDNSKVSDHHAIIPTEQHPHNTSTWRAEERRIYDLVVRRFLSVFFPDHEYLSTTVILQSNGEYLKASGKVVLAPGWKILYEQKDKDKIDKTTIIKEKAKEKEEGEDENENEDSEQALPPLKKGERRQAQSIDLLIKQTKAPPPYTDATLLQAMETAGKLVENEELRLAMKDSGLGTPATRAEIIEKLIRVGYLIRDKKKILPTAKGIQLIGLVDSQVSSPELTGTWEKRLSEIAKGLAEDSSFMADIEAFVKDAVERVRRDKNLVHFTPQMKVNAALAPSTKRDTAKSPHQMPKQNASSAKSKDQQRNKSASDNKPQAQLGLSPTGRPVLAICPACGRGNIIEGRKGYGCDRFKEGCSYVVWKVFQGKKLPLAAIKALINGKPTRTMQGFIGKDGQPIKGKLRMRPDGKGIELIEIKPRSKS